MDKIYHLYELSAKQKRKFYSQEIFEDFSKTKIWLCIITVMVSVFDVLLSGWIRPLLLGYSDIHPNFLAMISLLAIATIAYILSYLGFLNKLGSKALKVKIILNASAGLCYSAYIFLISWMRIEEALKVGSEEEWIRSHLTFSYSIYITLLASFISPFWALRAIVPCCYYLGMTVPFIKINHSQLSWIVLRNAVSIIYVFVLVWLASNFKWELFLKGLGSETWNLVYKDILDRNPSSIVLIGERQEIIYSNAEFKRVSQDSPKKFFDKVIQLSMRQALGGSKTPYLGVSILSVNLEESRNLFDSTTNFVNRKFRTLQPSSTFHNLTQLLVHYQSQLEANRLESEDQLVFDGIFNQDTDCDETLSFEVIIRPLKEYKKIIVVLNNTTDRDIKVSLENNNEFKDKLLASVSHELRTPLNANLGLLQAALNDNNLPGYIKSDYLIPAFRSGKLLSHLINDILDYSQLQNETIILSYEIRSLRETLEYCYHLLEHSFEMKRITFDLKINHDIPFHFRTDHDRLTQIILNLLSNAIKFTKEGGNVSVEVVYFDELRAEIRVNDTGIGMSQDEISKLFEENTLREKLINKKRLSKGNGLGLKIANKLAQCLDDGQTAGLQVTSSYKKGSTFSFIIKNVICSYLDPNNLNSLLPSSKIQEDKEAEASFHKILDVSIPDVPSEFLESTSKNFVPPPSLVSYSQGRRTSKLRTYMPSEGHSSSELRVPNRHKRVLIIDDDPFNILALRSMLDQMGITCDSACDGRQGVDQILADPLKYHLIFMDCQMPVMDGYEATHELTQKMQEGTLPEIPIIGCTAFTGTDKVEECFKCGMKHVLNKPVMRNKLQSILKKYLE